MELKLNDLLKDILDILKERINERYAMFDNSQARLHTYIDPHCIVLRIERVNADEFGLIDYVEKIIDIKILNDCPKDTPYSFFLHKIIFDLELEAIENNIIIKR